jgi:hypothetical protein
VRQLREYLHLVLLRLVEDVRVEGPRTLRLRTVAAERFRDKAKNVSTQQNLHKLFAKCTNFT